MLHLRNFIKLGYYPISESAKAFLLIAFFQFGLYYIWKNYHLPIDPDKGFEIILVYTLIGFVILGWLLGERKRLFLVVSYFVTFQIVGLALIEREWEVVPRVLTPVFFTYLTLFLFKSPAEFSIEEAKKRRREIVKELALTKQQLRDYQLLIRELKVQYENTLKEKEKLEKLLKENPVGELKKLLEEKETLLSEYRSRMENLNRTVERLKANNQQLWELLEEVSTEKGSDKKVKEKLREVRKELKICQKERRKIEEELKECKDYSLLLEEENKNLGSEVENLKENLQRCLKENKELSEGLEKYRELLQKDWLKYLNLLLERFKFTPEALKDLTNLRGEILEALFKYLKKVDRNPELLKLEKLEVAKGDIFRARFHGGRLFLKRTENGFEIVGILQGEDEKTKDRFIRERFS